MMMQAHRSSIVRTRRQQGISLIFALIGLAVLTLAAVTLVRSVDTGTTVLGNLGFKQDATKSSDQGAEQAIVWLDGAAATGLYNDAAAAGYWASSHDNVDPTGGNTSNAARAVIDWNGNDCASYPSGSYSGGCLRPVDGTDVNGNKTQFVIFRLCPTVGEPNAAGNDCAQPIAAQRKNGSITRGEINYRKNDRLTTNDSSGGATAYYRIIVRTVGGKNAVSYTETIVHK